MRDTIVNLKKKQNHLDNKAENNAERMGMNYLGAILRVSISIVHRALSVWVFCRIVHFARRHLRLCTHALIRKDFLSFCLSLSS